MAGYVETEHFFFALQLVARGPVVDFRQRLLVMLLLRERSEQAFLAVAFIAPVFHAPFHGTFDRQHELGARPLERIHRTGANQTFDGAAVEGSEVHGFAELVDGAEAADLLARFANGFHRRRTEILHRAETEAN